MHKLYISGTESESIMTDYTVPNEAFQLVPAALISNKAGLCGYHAHKISSAFVYTIMQ